MTLPLETINGKQYQPIHCEGEIPKGGWCAICCKNCSTSSVKPNCTPVEREDKAMVYFIEPGDTNEQEKIKQES